MLYLRGDENGEQGHLSPLPVRQDHGAAQLVRRASVYDAPAYTRVYVRECARLCCARVFLGASNKYTEERR